LRDETQRRNQIIFVGRCWVSCVNPT